MPALADNPHFPIYFNNYLLNNSKYSRIGFYNILKIPARCALHFYCRKLLINNKEILNIEGPLLIAANHPNSFLDAIIIATIFKNPVHSLTRGDAFTNSFVNNLLRSLKMQPVYRVSEGVENLEHNYTTFDECINIFKNNGTVLIFSEGRCINEWHLRPLKKGTARLAISAWQQGIPLKILPLGINYSSFRSFGKNVILNFGEVISKNDFEADIASGKAILSFNQTLNEQLKDLVFEIDPKDKASLKRHFYIPQSLIKKAFLFIPSIAGYLLHFVLYYLIVLVIQKKAEDHFDSVVVGLLFILYPIYVLTITLLIFFTTGNPIAFLILLLFPLTAICLLHYKKQIK